MKKLKKILERKNSLRRFEDKRVFTWNVRIFDAPAQKSSVELSKIFLHAGIKRFFNIVVLGEEYNYIVFEIRKDQRIIDDEYRIFMVSNIVGVKKEVEVIKVSPGQRFIITLTLSDNIHVRINNRSAVLTEDCSDVNSGYTTNYPQVNGWALKFDSN